MIELVVWAAVAVLALGAAGWNLAALIIRDGYGSNPVPRSRIDDGSGRWTR